MKSGTLLGMLVKGFRAQSIRQISGEAREMRIPILQGHVAAKDWGDPSGTPIIGKIIRNVLMKYMTKSIGPFKV